MSRRFSTVAARIRGSFWTTVTLSNASPAPNVFEKIRSVSAARAVSAQDSRESRKLGLDGAGGVTAARTARRLAPCFNRNSVYRQNTNFMAGRRSSDRPGRRDFHFRCQAQPRASVRGFSTELAIDPSKDEFHRELHNPRITGALNLAERAAVQAGDRVVEVCPIGKIERLRAELK